MGIIIKQSIKGTIWSYIGVIIGFITTSYLYPNYLTTDVTDVVGLFGLLVAYSTLLGQFSLLGLPGVTARLFSRFRNKNENHNGFLFISLIFFSIGTILFLAMFLFFSPWLAENNQEKSTLFAEYLYLLVPITIFSMIFIQLDTYNKVLYDAVFGTFLQEFLQRAFIFVTTLLFVFKVINLKLLIISYAFAISIKGLIIIIFLLKKGELNFTPNRTFLTKDLKKEVIDVALFSIVGSLGYLIVFNIDKIVINQMLDLSNTGVYTIAFYFGSLVVIPSRPLLKISGTLIADAWARNDIKKIEEIYYKSCINQLIIGSFLFIGIWANIDNIIQILGEDYAQSKWVIFYIGLGYLFDMATGANAQIISYSKYYRAGMVFIFFLLGVTIISLYLLIPLYGITGAAIAIAASLMIYNLMRYFFIYIKMRLQPFDWRIAVTILAFASIYFVTTLIPQLPLVADILVRGSLITLLSVFVLLMIPLSKEFNSLIEKYKPIVTGYWRQK